MPHNNSTHAEVARATILTYAAHAVGLRSPITILGASLLGERADLAIELDECECARRHDAAAGRLDDFDILMFLMAMPHGEPVPVEALSIDERAILHRVPVGAVETRDDGIVRLARPPVRTVVALVHDDNWQRGLRAASVFAPVATRMLIVPALSSDAAALLAEAAEYGIGVGALGATGVSIHLPPEGWRPRYFTPGGWLFREQVYQLAAVGAC